jgi:UDP-N-acetylglucosamine--N-acetylmuramyl-(pentapeptide) pyrophosphoryl-undecaprenol N-acetylglucosamine transferase
MKVVIAGGGTAGHVNPAIALGKALTDHNTTFVGTLTGAEAALVPAAGFPLEPIEVRGFDRARPLSIFSTGVRAFGAVFEARKILKRIRPAVVVGMGGYVALPVVLAARSLRIPVVLHEQNIVFGLTNRITRRFAKRVAVSFEESLAEAGSRGVNTGNPVVPEIAEMDVEAARKAGLDRFDLDPSRRTLLVFGGSQGARRINEAAVKLKHIWSDKEDRQVVHITGASEATQVEDEEKTQEGALVFRSVGFVDEMAEAYAVADIALSRGGASTVAELAAVGLPAVIVPYPHHRDRQQELHGHSLERAGAAVVVPDVEATGEHLASVLEPILGDETKLENMTKSAREFGRPDAANQLARIVEEAAA